MAKRPKRSSLQPTPSLPPREMYSGYVHGQTLPASWSQDTYARWFFDFLRTDLTTLTPGQRLGMRADAQAFLGPAFVEGTMPAEGVENMPALADESLHPVHREARAVIQAQLPTVETLQQLQHEARAGIQRVRKGDWWELEHAISHGIHRLGNHIVRIPRRGTFRELFLAAAMDTVQTCWPDLRPCPRCDEIFLKVGKQKYCSPTCATRSHWDAFKGRRSDRNHHKEYERRTKKRLGPNVKVKPRRRT